LKLYDTLHLIPFLCFPGRLREYRHEHEAKNVEMEDQIHRGYNEFIKKMDEGCFKEGKWSKQHL